MIQLCNGCGDARACVLRKRFYIHRSAHKHYRDLLEKCREVANITQADISLVLSHANSYSRPSREDKSPYDLFAFRYGTALLDKLGIRRIAPGDIVLKPSLPTR